jgi:hypothetical protein
MVFALVQVFSQQVHDMIDQLGYFRTGEPGGKEFGEILPAAQFEKGGE